ncbi:tyrosine-type recombinase/integrase [Fusobacterium necrophorum subsp. funduliforme]
MSAYKDKVTGKWNTRFYYKDYFGKNIKKHKRGFDTKREALEWERDFKSKFEASPTMKFKVLEEIFFEEAEKTLQPTTYENRKNIFKNNISDYFKEMKVNEITPNDIRNWKNQILSKRTKKGKKFSQTYLRTIFSKLNAIFNFAIKYYKLKDNPCKSLTLGSLNTEEEMEIWELNEFYNVIAMMERSIYRNMIIILYWTGMRIGELLALKYEDLTENYLYITKALKRTKGKKYIGSTKNKIKRRILVNEMVIQAIEDTRKIFYQAKDTDIIFPVSSNALRVRMKKAAGMAGIKCIRIHDLRHSHVSYLISHDIDIVTVSKRLGHKKVKQTLDTYAHFYKQVENRLSYVLENGSNMVPEIYKDEIFKQISATA